MQYVTIQIKRKNTEYIYIYINLFPVQDFLTLTVTVCVVFFPKKQEMRELQESLKETSVVVQMDNSRALNMDQIVSEVRAQYEDIAARSREDAEAWHKNKVSNTFRDAK